jgi:hypothetical protein
VLLLRDLFSTSRFVPACSCSPALASADFLINSKFHVALFPRHERGVESARGVAHQYVRRLDMGKRPRAVLLRDTRPSGTLLSDMPGNYSSVFMRQTFVLTNVPAVFGLTEPALHRCRIR